MLTLGERNDGQHVPAHVGDVLTLQLPENATTGYRWAPDTYDAKALAIVEETADYPSAAVGSGGEAVFRFRVVRAGSSALVLKYWRHWEGATSIQRRFTVTVDAAA